jgi:hypothetical protein
MLAPLQDAMTRIARPMTQRPSILLGVHPDAKRRQIESITVKFDST